MQLSLAILTFITSAIFAGAFVSWMIVGTRLRRREPLLQYEPRRPVPWNGVDLLLVIAILVLTQFVLVNGAVGIAGITLPKDPTQYSTKEQTVLLVSQFAASLTALILAVAILRRRTAATAADFGVGLRRLPYDASCGLVAFGAVAPVVFLLQVLLTKVIPYEHPVINLIEKQPSVPVLAMMTLSAVVIAPVVEEFLFRGLLQGWLEKLENSLIRKNGNESNGESDSLEDSACDATTDNAVVARVALYGFSPGFVPVVISSLLFALMHYGHGPAIIPLFLFALVLGYLYRQTHRLAPSILVHLLLNGISMLALLAEMARTTAAK
jgi:membrane protease YdiL (CAAX protease family)